ncbi:MAG: hypothetical protein K5868_02935 [Lachnospiraceae bacterium]|nr:hypothetical protein [Lachnospiraceae bacterium]
MIEVLVSWIFIAITSYVIGFEVLELLLHLLIHGNRAEASHPHVLRCLVGLACINAYAQIISLFAGVGMWADYILLFACLLIVFVDKDRLGRVMNLGQAVSAHPYRSVVYLVLILLMAYGTSRGYMHFDTNLYHAQAIHWIEDYGVVPGLANIQSRFGYNSAEFALNALYGFKWLTGRSLHTSAGFFALLSSFTVVGIVGAFKRDDAGKIHIVPRVSDYVRIGLIYYLGLIYSEMISPASDYYAQLLLFNIVIMWLDAASINTSSDVSGSLYAAGERQSIYGILTILVVYAVTIKLSLAPLVLLALIPGLYWIKNKNYMGIITCLISGLIIAVPYLIRGHFISGWVLYPSTLISFGTPDWQMPVGMAKYDAKEIGMWGRGIMRAEGWDSVTAFNWIPGYISALSVMEKLWLLAAVASLVCVIILAIKAAALRKSGNNDERLQIIPLMLILCIGMITWFIKAPLVRYGYSYIIILPLLTLGYILRRVDGLSMGNRTINIRVISFVILSVIIVLLKAKGLISDIIRTAGMEYYVNQQDYIDGDAFTYTVDGITFYVAEDAGQIGYYKMPSTVEERHDFALRGQSLRDGFRYSE